MATINSMSLTPAEQAVAAEAVRQHRMTSNAFFQQQDAARRAQLAPHNRNHPALRDQPLVISYESEQSLPTDRRNSVSSRHRSPRTPRWSLNSLNLSSLSRRRSVMQTKPAEDPTPSKKNADRRSSYSTGYPVSYASPELNLVPEGQENAQPTVRGIIEEASELAAYNLSDQLGERIPVYTHSPLPSRAEQQPAASKSSRLSRQSSVTKGKNLFSLKIPRFLDRAKSTAKKAADLILPPPQTHMAPKAAALLGTKASQHPAERHSKHPAYRHSAGVINYGSPPSRAVGLGIPMDPAAIIAGHEEPRAGNLPATPFNSLGASIMDVRDLQELDPAPYIRGLDHDDSPPTPPEKDTPPEALQSRWSPSSSEGVVEGPKSPTRRESMPLGSNEEYLTLTERSSEVSPVSLSFDPNSRHSPVSPSKARPIFTYPANDAAAGGYSPHTPSVYSTPSFYTPSVHTPTFHIPPRTTALSRTPRTTVRQPFSTTSLLKRPHRHSLSTPEASAKYGSGTVITKTPAVVQPQRALSVESFLVFYDDVAARRNSSFPRHQSRGLEEGGSLPRAAYVAHNPPGYSCKPVYEHDVAPEDLRTHDPVGDGIILRNWWNAINGNRNVTPGRATPASPATPATPATPGSLTQRTDARSDNAQIQRDNALEITLAQPIDNRANTQARRNNTQRFHQQAQREEAERREAQRASSRTNRDNSQTQPIDAQANGSHNHHDNSHGQRNVTPAHSNGTHRARLVYQSPTDNPCYSKNHRNADKTHRTNAQSTASQTPRNVSQVQRDISQAQRDQVRRALAQFKDVQIQHDNSETPSTPEHTTAAALDSSTIHPFTPLLTDTDRLRSAIAQTFDVQVQHDNSEAHSTPEHTTAAALDSSTIHPFTPVLTDRDHLRRSAHHDSRRRSASESIHGNPARGSFNENDPEQSFPSPFYAQPPVDASHSGSLGFLSDLDQLQMSDEQNGENRKSSGKLGDILDKNKPDLRAPMRQSAYSNPSAAPSPLHLPQPVNGFGGNPAVAGLATTNHTSEDLDAAIKALENARWYGSSDGSDADEIARGTAKKNVKTGAKLRHTSDSSSSSEHSLRERYNADAAAAAARSAVTDAKLDEIISLLKGLMSRLQSLEDKSGAKDLMTDQLLADLQYNAALHNKTLRSISKDLGCTWEVVKAIPEAFQWFGEFAEDSAKKIEALDAAVRITGVAAEALERIDVTAKVIERIKALEKKIEEKK